jgi:hypothetical protein
MPLTAFQKEIARVIATNRSPASHLAGGAVLNRAETGLRFSDDIDIFHDTAESIDASAEADEQSLLKAGYCVTWTDRSQGLSRAEVSRGADHTKLDWTTDSAFRFFPVQRDEEFGYCLHPADIATNKMLALAGRGLIRDYLDILQLDQDYLSLGTLCWAACGKDAGFTPDLILQMSNRHSRYQDEDLRDQVLTRPVDLKQLKLQWIAARARAEALAERLPPEELGCLYLNQTNEPVNPDPDSPEFPGLIRHFGRVGGAWPRIS